MKKEKDRQPIQQETTAAVNAAHLLYPAKHFDHPSDVLAAEDIGKDEKRAILASWASDVFAIESMPSLRVYPGGDKAVSYDEIIEALKTLDKEDEQSGEDVSSRSLSLRLTTRRRAQARRFGSRRLSEYLTGEYRRHC